MRVCCRYYSDLTLRARRLVAKGVVKVLQFKATVWPKVPSESTETQKFQNWSIPQTPLVSSCFCIPYCKRLKSWAWPWYGANVVCPRCALASSLFYTCNVGNYKAISFPVSINVFRILQRPAERPGTSVVVSFLRSLFRP